MASRFKPEGSGRCYDQARCTAMIGPSVTGRQCPKEALSGDDRCERHPHGKWSRNENGNYPKFYRNTLRPTLLKRVEEALGQCTTIEQLDVTTELVLTREAVSHRIALYGDLLEAQVAGQPITVENLVAAAELMRAGLQDVVKIAEVAARVERVKSEVASSYSAAMANVITTVMQAIRDVFEDDHRVGKVEMILRDSLRAKALPGADGTDLTPEMDAIEMDSSIPKGPIEGETNGEPNSANQAQGLQETTPTSQTQLASPPDDDETDATFE